MCVEAKKKIKRRHEVPKRKREMRNEKLIVFAIIVPANPPSTDDVVHKDNYLRNNKFGEGFKDCTPLFVKFPLGATNKKS